MKIRLLKLLLFQDFVDDIWVDFNLTDEIITWYCAKDSFIKKKDGNEEYAENYALLTLLAFDVENIEILT